MNRNVDPTNRNTTGEDHRPDPRITGPEFGELWRRCGLTPNEIGYELARVEPSIRSVRDLAFLETLTVVPVKLVAALRRNVSAQAFTTHLRNIRAEAEERREAEARRSAPGANTFGAAFGDLVGRQGVVREEGQR